MRRISPLAILTLCLLQATLATAETVTYTPLTFPTAGNASWDFSPDGDIAGLDIVGDVYRWTAEAGFELLGQLENRAGPVGMSNDGTIFVATDLDVPDTTGVGVPVRYVEGQGWEVLGAHESACVIDGQLASASDVSGDGQTVVGMTWLCGADVEAFSWTEAGGFVALGRNPDGGSRAARISDDGSTIVGWNYPVGTTSRSPVRWVDNGPFDHFLGTGFKGEATGVNTDGSMICGTIWQHSFYYNGAGNVVEFQYPGIDVNDFTKARSIADDGTVVGWYGNTFYQTSGAFIWRAGMGISDLKQWANDRGAGIPADMSLLFASRISADGSTIACQVYAPPDSNGVSYNGILLELSGARTDVASVPSREEVRLHAPYPNPFNPSTTVAFDLERSEMVQLDILDVAGRKVRNLAWRTFAAGRHELRWDGRDDGGRRVSSGSYFARLATEASTRTQKLTLVQ